jgi:NitT/TauT family transport system substrate-binding protein
MKKMAGAGVLVLLLALGMSVMAGCRAPAAGTPEPTGLKIGLLPILDTIPFAIAEQNGYFKEQGIQVEFVAVKSAQERDALLQTGQIDGVINDLISAGLVDKETPRIKVVRVARRSYPDAPQFRLLAAPAGALRTAADLRGVPIGISQNTVIEYITYRLLQAQGLANSDIAIQEVTAIPVRYEQLMNGNLKAATLPDPLAQGAVAAGAHLIVDDSRYPQYSISVISFRVETLAGRPNTVKKLLVAWEKAVAEVNANPARYQDLLIQKGQVPQSIQGTYRMPPFPAKGVPAPSEVADAVQWMLEKGLVARTIPYADMVDASFLPQ